MKKVIKSKAELYVANLVNIEILLNGINQILDSLSFFTGLPSMCLIQHWHGVLVIPQHRIYPVKYISERQLTKR
jgi:hypothetical protein